MHLISHRGNLYGKAPSLENHPEYVQATLDLGYDVEIDIWRVQSKLYLGHDKPQYDVDMVWLEKYADRLWLHCKNLDALAYLDELNSKTWTGYHYFWHQNDDVTLTSKGYIWAYPGKQPIQNSIAVLPELHNDNIDMCTGICSDEVAQYKLQNK